MSYKVRPVKGMKDLYGDAYNKFHQIVNIFSSIAMNYGFTGFDTPILEYTELFTNSLGESSDVVNKEMYSFLDRSDCSVTMRPEFTASIARACISSGLQQSVPLKLYSYGPLFRYERPQKGRLRQFHQINAEYVGVKSAIEDAEMILMASTVLQNLGIDTHDLTLSINSLGDTESRAKHRDMLIEYFNDHINDLSEDSKFRLTKNPLRILDSKDDGDRKLLGEAPKLQEYYTADSQEHYDQLKSYLDNFGVNYIEDDKLVRGLDYYSHTVFEFITDKLGAQATVLAGGRYENLFSKFGGGDIKSVGFAAGIERLMELSTISENKTIKFGVIAIGDVTEYAMHLAKDIRDRHVVCQFYYGSKVQKMFKLANKDQLSHVFIIGEDEKIKVK